MNPAAVNPRAASSLEYGEPFNPYQMFGQAPLLLAIKRSKVLTDRAKLAMHELFCMTAEAGLYCPSIGLHLADALAWDPKVAWGVVQELERNGLISRIRLAGANGQDNSLIQFLWNPIYNNRKVTQRPGSGPSPWRQRGGGR